MEEAGFMTYTEASHQRAIETFWRPSLLTGYWLSLFSLYVSTCNLVLWKNHSSHFYEYKNMSGEDKGEMMLHELLVSGQTFLFF